MNNKEQFIYEAYPIVLKYLNELGIDGKTYAPYVLAQAALESDYGQSPSGDYNYFGMKAKKGDNSKTVTTHEGYNSNRTKTSAQFSNFKSMEDGLKQGINRLLNDFGQFHDIAPSPEKWINNALHGKFGKYFTDDPQKYLNNFRGVLNGSIINRIVNTHYPNSIEHFGLQQYLMLPANQNKPPYKNKTLQDYMTIQTHKQGGNMKVKNQTTLIPRHQTGGLVPKYQNSGFLSRVWNNAKKRTRNDILGKHGIVGRILAMPGELVRGLVTEPILVANTTTTTQSNQIPVNVGNVEIPIPVDKPKTQNPGTQGKPAGTKGSGTKGGTRGSGTRGNARTTAKPAATTFTESPTNITDQGWLDARNAAMQRGWGTYNYNGQTYQFTGDEQKQADNNWRNRRKAGYQAEGILDLNPPAEVTE